jgi:hypothetical protein
MGTIKLYKKYRKLQDGGPTKFSQGAGYANTGLQVASTASDMIPTEQNEFGVQDDTMAVGKGALKGAAAGAAMGSVVGPWGTVIGGAVGGVAGGIKGGIDNNKAKEAQEAFMSQQRQLRLQNSQNQWQQTLNNGFQVQGNMNAQKYAKNGGLLSTMYKNGGTVEKLSKTNVQFNGKSHENGGIKEPLVNGVKLNQVEVEGKESMSTSNGQKFVFSENLGFAQQHKPLARAMGKIEKKLKSNPNDPISTRTLNTLKEREEQLKYKQEETKEALGLENNLGEMRMGGAIKRKDGVYIDREGVMKYPLKNGGLTKYAPGGITPVSGNPYDNSEFNFPTSTDDRYSMDDINLRQTPLKTANQQNLLRYQGYKNKVGRNINEPVTVDGKFGQNTLEGFKGLYRPLSSDNGSSLSTVKGVEMSNVDDTQMMLPEGKKGSKINWGNVAGKIIPYAGVASNYMLNEKARNMATPKEALPDYVKYKPVDYSASKIEADQQRRQLNKSLTQNVTNSAVAAALKAKNLGTTIGAKNMINQEEMNVNTQGINQNNLYNNQIQSRRNQIDVENRDRDYNKEQRYLTQKGQIVNNFSDIYQKQGRDQRLEGLENRKIDVLSKYDMNRGVHEREIIVPSIVDKQSRGQQLSKQEQDFMDKNPDLFKRNGGLIKKSNKLYNKLKK